MLEGVVVCPLDRERLFGELVCDGPFQNSLSNPDDASDIALACGGGQPRLFGTYGNNQVWGCGFGLDATRSGRSPNIDQADRFGLVLPQRLTFRCTANTDYCSDR